MRLWILILALVVAELLGNVSDDALLLPFQHDNDLWRRIVENRAKQLSSTSTSTSTTHTESTNLFTASTVPNYNQPTGTRAVVATPIANNQPVNYVMKLNDTRIYNLTDIPAQATTIYITANICAGPPNLNYKNMSMNYDYTAPALLKAGWNPQNIQFSMDNFEFGFANLTIDVSAVQISNLYIQLDFSNMTFDTSQLEPVNDVNERKLDKRGLRKNKRGLRKNKRGLRKALEGRKEKDSAKDEDKAPPGGSDDGDSVVTAAPSDVTNDGVSKPAAPTAQPDASQPGEFTYSLGVSWEAPLYSFKDSPNLYLVDSDYNHALFVTGNLTTDPQNATSDHYIVDIKNAIYDITAFPMEDVQQMWWLSNSFCALQKGPSVLNSGNCDVSYTRRGLGHYYKQQFFMKGLNNSASYFAVLSKPNTKTPGGTVYDQVWFSSKTSDNCQLVYDLDFCSDVAYAVPGNSSMVDSQELAKLYDDNASKWWQNFTYSQQIVACNASLDSRYSILKSCDDCADSYKQWLCAVTIPRCADWSNNATFLQERPPGTSRNELIDRVLKPGRYKEILPCLDLCQKIVQDCDASLGFQCPKLHRGQEHSYGLRSDDGDITCSYLGAVYFLDGARALTISIAFLAVSFFFVILW
ncbi:Calcium influx-promoting protein [Yarrowia sp. B02]|nr:Calcium influx-promoting protein [Yarrowia sp. B02]